MSDLSADLSLDLGAHDGGIIADLLAKIHLGLNDTVVELQKANMAEQRRLASLPNFVTYSQSTQVTGTALLNFRSPQNGRQWNVRLLTATSNDGTANATQVAFFVGTNTTYGTSSILPGTMFRWVFPSLPGIKDLNGAIIVNPNETLFAYCSGIPASSNIVVNISVEDEPQDGAQTVVAELP